ncbi:PUB domain-containing protein [Toxoplasma gondii]|nr:PUB domain-containing protein [Toxoplasma gondii]
MQPFVDKLVKDNWLDTADSLRALSAPQWSQLQLPLRLEELLKKKLNASPAPTSSASASSGSVAFSPSVSFSPCSSSPAAPAASPASPASREEQASSSTGSETEAPKKREGNVFTEEDFAVVYAAVTDETLFPFSLTEAIEKLQIDVPRDSLAGVLRTLFTVIDGVLAQPSNPKKRRLRKANSSFHSQVGQFRAAVRVMEAAGFCEGKMRDPASGLLDDFWVMDTAYVMRLTDAHHLLAQLAEHAGVPAPPLPSSGFNPYSSSIVSASGTSLSQVAGQHGQMRKIENAQLKEKIRQREQLLETGGGEEVPLSPAVYALEELRQREKAEKASLAPESSDVDECPAGEKPTLTAADIARIKEIMGEGPSFRSRMQQQLEQLEKRKVFKRCTVRVLLPDRAVLQLSFAPHKTLRFVREQVQQFLHPLLRSSSGGGAREECFSRWFLCETPPLRKVELHKTLYQEGLLPNCTLHLKFPDACPRFPHSFLDPEALQLHNLRYSALSPSSSSSSSFSDSSPGDISGGSRSVVASAERHADRLNEQLSAQSGGEGVPQVARLSSASGPSGVSAAERMQGGEKSAVTKKSSLARSLFKRK